MSQQQQRDNVAVAAAAAAASATANAVVNVINNKNKKQNSARSATTKKKKIAGDRSSSTRIVATRAPKLKISSSSKADVGKMTDGAAGEWVCDGIRTHTIVDGLQFDDEYAPMTMLPGQDARTKRLKHREVKYIKRQIAFVVQWRQTLPSNGTDIIFGQLRFTDVIPSLGILNTGYKWCKHMLVPSDLRMVGYSAALSYTIDEMRHLIVLINNRTDKSSKLFGVTPLTKDNHTLWRAIIKAEDAKNGIVDHGRQNQSGNNGSAVNVQTVIATAPTSPVSPANTNSSPRRRRPSADLSSLIAAEPIVAAPEEVEMRDDDVVACSVVVDDKPIVNQCLTTIKKKKNNKQLSPSSLQSSLSSSPMSSPKSRSDTPTRKGKKRGREPSQALASINERRTVDPPRADYTSRSYDRNHVDQHDTFATNMLRDNPHNRWARIFASIHAPIFAAADAIFSPTTHYHHTTTNAIAAHNASASNNDESKCHAMSDE